MIAATEERITGLRADQITVAEKLPTDAEHFSMEIAGKLYDSKKEAGLAIIAACSGLKAIHKDGEIGHYAGFSMSVHFDAFNNKFELTLKGQSSYKVDVGTDGLGNITRINNALEAIPSHLGKAEERLETLHQQMETAKAEMEKPFAQIDDLKEMEARLSELNALLNMDSGSDRSDAEARDDEPEERISADKPAARESVMDRLKKMQSKVKPSVEGTEHPSKHKQQEI
jgi:hypothetical protein